MSSIHNYIEHQLGRRSLGIYFRKGKWILHLVLLLLFIAAYLVKYTRDDEKQFKPERILWAVSLLAPFMVFFYFYCLYLIPFCFKRNKFKKFWIVLLLVLATFPLIDYGLQELAMPHLPKLQSKQVRLPQWFIIGKTYFNFVTAFIGFTAMLYFMEILEGINIHKETDQNKTMLTATELHRIKTQMNPDFMVRSLDGIIALADHQDERAPGSVVDFSDVLRYRLYRSKEKLVPLNEELGQLNNLFRLHNAIPGQSGSCTLEIEGDPELALVVPLSLINVVEPLLTTFEANTDWSLLMYLLLEEREIQVAVEMTGADVAAMESQAQRIHEDLQQLLYTGLNFTVEKEHNTFSLRTCTPIFRNLIVSS
jgi:two-component system LytT family sensor kinase